MEPKFKVGQIVKIKFMKKARFFILERGMNKQLINKKENEDV